MYPSEGNISGQKNFKRPAIPLMDSFDESFWVRVPRGRAGTGLLNTPISHPFYHGVKPDLLNLHLSSCANRRTCSLGDLRASAVKSAPPESKRGLTGNTPRARLKYHGKASGWHPLWWTQRRT